MKKLQRYSTSDGLACILGGAGEHPGKVCLDADVSALEAENERLIDELDRLCGAANKIAVEKDFRDFIVAIELCLHPLNREQEKQL